MKITKKHLFETFDAASFHDCGCEFCDGGDSADSLEALGERIEAHTADGYEVDIYLVPRKVKK